MIVTFPGYLHLFFMTCRVSRIYCNNILLFQEKLDGFAKTDSYFEAFSEVSLFTLDIILQCAFSMKSNCQTIG